MGRTTSHAGIFIKAATKLSKVKKNICFFAKQNINKANCCPLNSDNRIMFKQKAHRRSSIPIKRVITQGNICICGICRKTYSDPRQANACLTRCLNGHLNPSEPVVALAEAGTKKFRCHFCRRVFTERNKAVECSSACKVKAKGLVQSEHPKPMEPQQANTLAQQNTLGKFVAAPEPAFVKPAGKNPVVRRDQMHKFFRDGRKLICRKCGSEKKNLDDVIACYDSHPAHIKREAQEKTVGPTKQVGHALKIVKPETPALEVEENIKTVRLANEDEKFLRDSARYVCRKCSKKFFTREEVIACYDGHAGEQPSAPVIKAQVAIATNEAEKVAKTPRLKNEDEKFLRDGARYICRTCQKKHFTRGEVTTCFDSHQ